MSSPAQVFLFFFLFFYAKAARKKEKKNTNTLWGAAHGRRVWAYGDGLTAITHGTERHRGDEMNHGSPCPRHSSRAPVGSPPSRRPARTTPSPPPSRPVPPPDQPFLFFFFTTLQ